MYQKLIYKDEQLYQTEQQLQIYQEQDFGGSSNQLQIKDLRTQIQKMLATEKKLLNENELLKKQVNESKQRYKDSQVEIEEYRDQLYELKTQYADVERLQQQPGGDHLAELKAQQLSQTVDKLQEQVKKDREKIKFLDAENGFYHKLNYLLQTIH